MAYLSANKKESNDINIINNPITNKVMSDVNNNVIKDCEAQYEIVSKTGDKIEMHVRAGLSAEAYLNAKNEVGYNKWKRIADSLN